MRIIEWLMLLCLTFLGLKLIGFIDWSWYWVMFPILGPIILFGSGIVLVVMFKDQNKQLKFILVEKEPKT